MESPALGLSSVPSSPLPTDDLSQAQAEDVFWAYSW